MGVIYAVPSQDFLQKSLDAQLLSTTTSAATLNSVIGIQNLPGVMVVNRVDINGTETPTKREVIAFTGTSGSTTVTLTRGLAGTTAKDHDVGSVVEFSPDVIWGQAIYDALSQLLTPSTGVIDLAKVLTPGDTQTVTGKRISGANNTLTGISEAMMSLSDVTTGNATTARHGFLLKLTGATTTFMRADGTWASPSAAGGGLSAFSNTASNASFTNSFTQVVTASITTTVTSKIVLIYNGLIAAGSAVAVDTQVQFKEGSTVISGPQQSGGNVGSNVNQFAVGASYTYAKTAGAYTFSVEMKNSFSSDAVNVGVVNLVVLAVPA